MGMLATPSTSRVPGICELSSSAVNSRSCCVYRPSALLKAECDMVYVCIKCSCWSDAHVPPISACERPSSIKTQHPCQGIHLTHPTKICNGELCPATPVNIS